VLGPWRRIGRCERGLLDLSVRRRQPAAEDLDKAIPPTRTSSAFHAEASLARIVEMTAAELVSRHHDAWRRAVSHPFLDAVGDGTLAEANFDRWLAQDYLFIADLLAFQAGLLARAPRPPQRTLAAGLVALDAELTWFEETARRRGLALTGSRHPTTEAYRTALVRLLDAGMEVALTGLWALERAYLEAWRGTAPGAPPYRPFVEHWTAPGFGRYVADLEELAGDGDATEAAFLEICELERGFWDMAWAP
jgi:thiaminase